MTCQHAYYDNLGYMQCEKKYPIRLMKCLKGGSPCYKPREGVKKKK